MKWYEVANEITGLVNKFCDELWELLERMQDVLAEEEGVSDNPFRDLRDDEEVRDSFKALFNAVLWRIIPVLTYSMLRWKITGVDKIEALEVGFKEVLGEGASKEREQWLNTIREGFPEIKRIA